MFKRNSLIAKGLSVIAFTIIWLLSSAIAATAQEPQQGAINTTRSNIKNTSRTAGVGRLDPLILRLKKAAGGTIASRQLADVDIDGKLSDAEGAFDFGALPAGDYVLTVSQQGQVATGDSNLKVARISLAGVVGGTVEKDWNLETSKVSDVSSENQRLGGLSSDFGQFKVPFKTDGKTSIAGKITLPTGSVIIKNIRRPD